MCVCACVRDRICVGSCACVLDGATVCVCEVKVCVCTCLCKRDVCATDGVYKVRHWEGINVCVIFFLLYVGRCENIFFFFFLHFISFLPIFRLKNSQSLVHKCRFIFKLFCSSENWKRKHGFMVDVSRQL